MRGKMGIAAGFASRSWWTFCASRAGGRSDYC